MPARGARRGRTPGPTVRLLSALARSGRSRRERPGHRAGRRRRGRAGRLGAGRRPGRRAVAAALGGRRSTRSSGRIAAGRRCQALLRELGSGRPTPGCAAWSRCCGPRSRAGPGGARSVADWMPDPDRQRRHPALHVAGHHRENSGDPDGAIDGGRARPGAGRRRRRAAGRGRCCTPQLAGLTRRSATPARPRSTPRRAAGAGPPGGGRRRDPDAGAARGARRWRGPPRRGRAAARRDRADPAERPGFGGAS